MLRLIQFVALLLVASLATGAPATPQQRIDVGDLEFFEKQVRPLLVRECYSCHSTKHGESEGGLVLDTRQGWVEGGENGPAIVPNAPEKSLLMRAVRHASAELKMPPDKKLSRDEIGILDQWIARGAPDPRVATTPAVNLSDPSDPALGRQHWAFRPLQTPVTPAVSAATRYHNRVDTFVLARLKAEGLTPSPTATKEVLLRRVYLQLTGLPPTAEQADAFLRDQRPDAYIRLVDQLLASPRFGEQWGRHWLDLARYADSNGLDENFLFREAWRFRNWVLQAINQDMPYDRFLLEQIAGDLLPFDDIAQRDRQRIASGFLVIGPKVLLGVNAEKQRLDVADEQVDTIGRAVLGQTLGCARCHDHKFDPIPTADYYALAGIFTSTQVMQQRYMLGQQRLMERLVGLGEQGEQRNQDYEDYWRAHPHLKKRAEQANAALDLLQKEDSEPFQKFAEEHGDAIADEAADAALPKQKRLESQQALVKQLAQKLANPPTIPPRAMICGEMSEPVNESIRIAGQFDQQGEEVQRGFLQVVGPSTIVVPDSQSGRHQLALWLTDVDQGAGRVAARVLANRIWQHMIGRGIVRTADNFGRTGEPPTHPQLLDYLADELIQSGWSIKHLVRTIALSHSFTQSSQHNSRNHQLDPDNRWLWRAHRRRLSPESLRDAMLLSADRLDVSFVDSTVDYLGDQATAVGANKNRRRTDFPCRSVYLPVIRNDLPEIFDIFNFADPHATTGVRPQTTVATQSLYLLNNTQVLQISQDLAERVSAASSDRDGQITALYRFTLGTNPTAEEKQQMLAFLAEADALLQQHESDQQKQDSAVTPLALACQALLASTRFQMME